MLEKTGTVVLTQNDLDELSNGQVSDRVKQTWGLSLEQLQELVKSKSYTINE